MAASMDVTVGIPTYNRSRSLEGRSRAFCGALPPFTLLVSDNASDDDTAAVVASFRDPRLVYRPLERNIGRAANINRLIELAETESMVCSETNAAHPSIFSDARRTHRWPRVGCAHRLRDHRHRREFWSHDRLMDEAAALFRIRSRVSRAEHEIRVDGVPPISNLPQAGSCRRRRPATGRRRDRRRSASHAHCDRLGLRLYQPNPGGDHCQFGRFIVFARLVHAQRVPRLTLPPRTCSTSEGGASWKRPTFGASDSTFGPHCREDISA